MFRAMLGCRYGTVIRALWRYSKAFRRHFLIEVPKLIRREVSELLKPNTSLSLCDDIILSNIEAFSWDSTLADIEETAPLSFCAVKAIASTKKNQESMLTNNGKSLKPVIGNALSCLLRGRHNKVKFIPTLNAMQLQKYGLKKHGLMMLSDTNMCLSNKSLATVLQKMSFGIDDAVQAYKNSVWCSEGKKIHSSKQMEQADETDENAEDRDSDDEDETSDDDLENEIEEDDSGDQFNEDDLEDQISENDLDHDEDQENEDDLENQVSEDNHKDQASEDDLDHVEDDPEDQLSQHHFEDDGTEDDLEVNELRNDLYNVDGATLVEVNAWNTEVEDLLMICENVGDVT